MEQFPLRGPQDGAMEIAALVPRACNEIAPSLGPCNGNCSIFGL